VGPLGMGVPRFPAATHSTPLGTRLRASGEEAREMRYLNGVAVVPTCGCQTQILGSPL
jgi:hypothetical protein